MFVFPLNRSSKQYIKYPMKENMTYGIKSFLIILCIDLLEFVFILWNIPDLKKNQGI